MKAIETIKHIIKAARVFWYRSRAKSNYLAYRDALGNLSCGKELALQFPSVSVPAARVDHYLDRLQELGETVPRERITK